MSLPDPFPYVPPLTIVPNPQTDIENFMFFMNRFYEDVATAVNNREIPYFQIQVSNVATDIPRLPTFGAFLVCVSGFASDQPVKTWSLVKSDETSAGVINVIGTQAGTNVWAGVDLTITSNATNFQIAHNGTLTETFNVRWIGTQI